jgi:hypothetical protein
LGLAVKNGSVVFVTLVKFELIAFVTFPKEGRTAVEDVNVVVLVMFVTFAIVAEAMVVKFVGTTLPVKLPDAATVVLIVALAFRATCVTVALTSFPKLIVVFELIIPMSTATPNNSERFE